MGTVAGTLNPKGKKTKAATKKLANGVTIGFLKKLGPGLVTGASDDDPSGIATYSQVGARFGYGLLWTMVLTYPLMAAIQEISARIGRVTGCGIAANLRKNYPRPVLYSVLLVVSVANVFNLGADIGAMGAAMQLVFPKTLGLFTVIFGVGSLAGVMLVPYSTYAKYLKWLTLSLFAYVGVVFFAHVSWPAVLHATLLPHLEPTKEYLTALIAVLGTTISPYLFFWQASQEVEEVRNHHGEKPLKRCAIAGGGATRTHSSGHLSGHGILQHRGIFHYLDRRGHASRSRNHRHFDFRASGSGTGTAGGAVRLPAVRLRHRRHRASRGTGARGIRMLRRRRSLPLENQP